MLFRQEVIDENTNKLDGDVLLLPKVSYVVLTTFVLIWVVLLGIWLGTSQYSRKETVIGWIEPSEGVVKIYNPLAGSVISKVFVTAGQSVAKGTPLVVLRNSKTLLGGGELSELLVAELTNQRLLISEQIERNKSGYPIKEKNLKDQKTSAREELVQLKNQLLALNEHESLVQSEAKKYQRLYDKKMISELVKNKSNKELLSIRSNKLSLLRSLNQHKNIIQKLDKEIELFPASNENTLSELNSRLNEIDQRLLRARSQNEVVIKAPISGRVDSIQAFLGQILSATTPILSLVPEESTFKVNLLVPVRAVGFIAEGQSLSIRYDAFPYQKFGSYKANIVKVAETVLLPNEILNLPAELKTAVYKVEATLGEENILAYGREVKLRSGMTLTADIYLSDRTLFDWLLEPIYSLKGRFQ